MTSDPGVASAHAVASRFGAARRRLALAVVALAFVLDVLDSTIVNVAIPSIRAGLRASDATVQWLVAGYALSFSMLLIVGGRLGDIVGYRTMFLLGVCAFTVASACCGLASTQGQIIAARVAQGGAAAMMAPQVMALVQLLYAPHERGPVMGLFGALGGLSASLGPVLGGVLIHADLFHLGWRPIFLINLPIALLALAGAWALPRGRSSAPLKPDITGALLVMASLLMLVAPLIRGRAQGWPLWSFASMAASAPMLALFAMHQRWRDRRDGSALAPPVLFKDPAFSFGLLANLCLQVALAGYFLSFSLTIQLGLGLNVLAAAMTNLPFAVGVGLGVGVVSRRLATWFGRRLTRVGMAVLVLGWVLLGLCLYAAHGVRPSPLQTAPILLLAGLGMGMAIGPLSTLTLSGVDVRHAGAASGVLNATQQLGGALGAAAIGAIYFAVQSRAPGVVGFNNAFYGAITVGAGLVLMAASFASKLPGQISRFESPAH